MGVVGGRVRVARGHTAALAEQCAVAQIRGAVAGGAHVEERGMSVGHREGIPPDEDVDQVGGDGASVVEGALGGGSGQGSESRERGASGGCADAEFATNGRGACVEYGALGGAEETPPRRLEVLPA